MSSSQYNIPVLLRPFTSLLVFLLFWSALSLGEPGSALPVDPDGPLAPRFNENEWFYRPKHSPRSPRQYVIPPLVSLLLPGTDQILETQPGYAGTYLAVGAGGLILKATATENSDDRYKDLGLSIYLTAGALSMYHSFRNATYSRKSIGEFLFLKAYDTPLQLATAPLNYHFLTRATTILPLAVSGLYFLFASPKDGGDGGQVSFNDFTYSLGNGFLSGISEECIFRGWAMPVLMHQMEDPNMAVLLSSAGGALTHGLRFKHFITSFILGIYTGWLVQRNGGSITESIFVHSWFDFMSFLGDYATHKEGAFLKLPTLLLSF